MPNDHFHHLFIAPARYDETLAFYRDRLGWSIDFTWGGDGEPRGCQLDGGGVRLVIAEQHAAADHSWSHGIDAHRPTLHLAVDDLDARYDELRGCGRVVVEPEATHWGTRWFVVRDPDDNLIAYEQPLAR